MVTNDDGAAFGGTRRETDALGAMEIPAGDLRGIHTHRALDNFSIAGRPTRIGLIHAYALVKKACALANRESGYLDAARADAICAACDEIASGELDRWFSIDALQGGAGTSTNMNLNEVIARRAAELLAGSGAPDAAGACVGETAAGGTTVDPHDHVNLHQSTNDTYPTALRVCLIGELRQVAESAAALQSAFQAKEREFAGVVTVGRTETQDAVPMTLGAIFSGFAEAVARDRWRAFKCEERVRAVNLGGTAVGTGLAAPRDYIFRVVDVLRALTGYGLARADNLVDQTANADAFAEVAGILQAMTVNLEKTARDLRRLAREGDISLSAVQAGSSIMPGKVNPVMAEAVIQAAMRARAEVSLVAEACAAGSLQINEFMPLIADSLLEATGLLTRAAQSLAAHVALVTADAGRCRFRAESNPIAVMAFVPFLGYDACQALLADYRAQEDSGGLSFRDFLISRLGADVVSRALAPEALSALGYRPIEPKEALP